MKKAKNKLNTNQEIALDELERQRNSYVRFIPFCETKADALKLTVEIYRLTEEINIILSLFTL